MACIVTLMGSVLGFFAAITALVMFQVPFLTALAIWSVTGIAGVAFGLILATTAPLQDADLASQELA
jgi:hypothetical protein